MPKVLSTGAASSRLETAFRRIFSATIFLSSVEVFLNASDQNRFLNSLSPLLLGLFFFTISAPLVSSFFGQAKNHWFWLHGAVSLATMLVWPLLVEDPNALPSDFQPWIWWSLGMAAISVGATTNVSITLIYLFSNSVIWFVLDTSAFAGGSDPWISFQDSVYIFFFSGAVIGLIGLVREWAKRADDASAESVKVALDRAQAEAAEKERSRIDAIIHDSVLNTLSAAARASDRQEKLAAVAMAQSALQSLDAAGSVNQDMPPVSVRELFRALRKAALRAVPHVTISPFVGSTKLLPGNVAQALMESTLQALDNAWRHSRGKSISLTMSDSKFGDVEITVEDDGVGFDLKSIPLDRSGIQNSIIARIELVGGETQITSKRESGTKVGLRWFS